MRGSSSTTFTLKGVNVIQLMLSRNVKSKKPMFIEGDNDSTIPSTILDTDSDDIPISDLLHERSKRVLYFLDTRKIQHKLWGIMIDVTENGPLPVTTSKPCWWCHHTFYTMPIGCPLRYHSHPTTISGGAANASAGIGPSLFQKRFEEKLISANYDITSGSDFFETEGYFCSFPCCKAYITYQKNSIKYKDSNSLLSLLYRTFYKREADFPEAPSWKLLKEYGGHLTIEEFRATFGQLEFSETVNIRRPYMFCASQYIAEKRVKLFKGIKET